MKNVHILPTSAPSRLYKNSNGILCFTDMLFQQKEKSYTKNQHVYITNDEPVMDWYISNGSLYRANGITNLKEIDKKIVKTNDEKLIGDGVQEMSFLDLKLIAKHPPLEEVNVIREEKLYISYILEKPLPKVEPKEPTFTKEQLLFAMDKANEYATNSELWWEDKVNRKSMPYDNYKQSIVDWLVKEKEQQNGVEKLAEDNGYFWKNLEPHEKKVFELWYNDKNKFSNEYIEHVWNVFVKESPPKNNGASSDFMFYLKQFKKES